MSEELGVANPDAELSDEDVKVEQERLRKLGYVFPHPEHVELKDGVVVYKANPPVIDKSQK